MTLPALYVDQRQISLGRRIGKGGEGEVFALTNDPSRAVKLYTVSDPDSREAKILAMVKAGLAAKTPLVSFPMSLVRRKDGKFAGFVMRLVDAHRPLHDLYAPGSRKHNFPQANYKFLVRSAANVARAVAAVHSSGCVIGDINHSSILVSKVATVALIDADSFQVSVGQERFHCRVGVPEYTPPELQGQSLADITRTFNHDAFGLAIVIFQLLFMGRHPFIGTVRKGDLPPLHEAIRDYRFVYAENRNVGMDQPPGTPVLSDFSPDIASSFESAFSRESSGQRQNAARWVEILDEFEKTLVPCKTNKLHFAPRDASDCPWCDMESQLGTFLFLPYIPEFELTSHPFDPGADGFNVDAVWSQINSIVCPAVDHLMPKLRTASPKPSNEAERVVGEVSNRKWLRIGAVILGLIVMFSAPALWFIWVPLGWFGFFGGSGGVNGTPFTRRYVEIETRWLSELRAWRKRCGVSDFADLKATLGKARDDYKALGGKEKVAINAYNQDRRNKQLLAFLDNFEICKAKIKGIGPAKEATLASYGIESAADIIKSKLLNVPGFGQVNSQGLLDWRAKVEKRFVYSPAPNDTDRQELSKIRLTIASEASSLRRTLLAGPHNLAGLVRRVSAAMEIEDPLLNKIYIEREQIKCDLNFLGISLPTVTFNPSSASRTTSSPQSVFSGGGVLSSTSSTRQTCPRCGSAMVRRVARRGARAGGAFWGCVRYPGCRGTRNI